MATDTSLFTRLKRLFSNDVIVRNIGGKKLKIVDTDRIEFATDRNSLRDRFNRLRSSTYNLHNRDQALSYQSARLELFRDYDTMDMDPILASALDIYCDEMLTKSEMGQILTVKSDDDNIKKILENLFFDILNIEFNLWSWARNMPVKYDSYIPLLDGRNVRIDDLSKEIKSGKENWTYSIQDKTNKIVPGKITWCDKNYTSNKIVRVTFDDNSFVETAPEHPFILRDGTEKRADELDINDSLMPFYRKLNTKKFKKDLNEYETVFDPSKNEYEFTHRIVADELSIKNYGEKGVIHHKDFNKYNNSPINLEKMDFYEHKMLHKKLCKAVLHSPEVTEKRLASLQKYLRSDKRKQYLSEKMKGKVVQYFDEYNKSNLHTSHNVIRSNKKREMWADPILREKYKSNMQIVWTDLMKDICRKYCATVSRGTRNAIYQNELNECLKNDESFMSDWKKYNVREFKRVTNLKNITTVNHKVKKVEFINEISDVYCMAVVGPNGENDRHNFSICGKDSSGNITKDSGVFVKNCKYGDFFLKLDISPEYGVFGVLPLSAYEITRVEGSDPTNKNYVKFQHDGSMGGAEYENFEIAHFRLLSDSNFLPYGKSVLEGARRVWKQLSLMEDAMLIHRIMRAPEKRIFKIDIGNIPPGEVDAYMEKLISKMKKTPYLDERTGDYNLRFNLQNMVEDFFLPVRGGDSGTSIEPLPGMEYTGTDDIEYLRNKMMAALKIPKAFLGYDENLSGKATLAAEDVRFARTIVRVQRVLLSELTKIAIVHLYSQGFTDASLVNFSLELTNPSTILEQEKIAIWNDKIAVSKDMLDAKIFSRKWIYKNVFELSEADAEEVEEDMLSDLKMTWRYAQIEEKGNDPATSGQAVGEEGELSDVAAGGEPDAGSEPEGGAPPEPTGGEAPAPPEPPPLKETADAEHLSRVEKASLNDKKNRKYPYGEDPLGKIENKANPRKISNPLTHKFRGNSPLALESDLKNLKSRLSGNLPIVTTKKQILKESPSPSMLDEDNIIDNDTIK